MTGSEGSWAKVDDLMLIHENSTYDSIEGKWIDRDFYILTTFTVTGNSAEFHMPVDKDETITIFLTKQ